jgi:D-3-phosphoglycerate dehydrogenase / 2-oxoglutarate reductase
METYRVVYYNIFDNLNYENSLLKKWNVNNLELVEVKDKESGKTFADYACDADGAVVEYELITRPVMEKLKQCRIIALQSIGYNNIDIQAATENGICVTNAPGFCTDDVALHCVGLLIDLVRNISYFDRRVRAGLWDYESAPHMNRICGKTIGLVFFGSIPQAMIPMLKSLGLRILAYAPTKTVEYLSNYGVDKAETLESLLRESDFVSLHMPLKDETFHMLGETQFKMMKETAFLVNTARGSVVDEKALVDALRNRTIAGAAVDVIEDSQNNQTELVGFDNVIITPHTAFLSDESFYGAREIALRQLVQRLVHQKPPENLVNRELAGQIS